MPGCSSPPVISASSDEPLAADRVVGVLLEDLLERHLAVQLGIERHEDLAQPAAGVRPQDAEPLAVAGGRADASSWRCGRRRAGALPWISVANSPFTVERLRGDDRTNALIVHR